MRCIVCTVKNEGPFLLEWLAYHRLIGFNRFVIFSNDCTDGTHEMLQALDAAGLVHHFDNTPTNDHEREADPQRRAYARANILPQVRESDWVMVIDGDEFFCIRAGNGTLDDLFAHLPPGTDAVAAQWRIFGSGGQIGFADDLQIAQFRLASPEFFAFDAKMLSVKSIFRPDPVHFFGVHTPVFHQPMQDYTPPIKFVNGSGTDITGSGTRQRWWTPPAEAGSTLCQVNHYMIRANEVFLMKRWRGTANSGSSERINFAYYDQFNLNYEENQRIDRWIEPVRAEVASLKSKHPELGGLHDRAVMLYSRQIEELKTRLRTESPEEYHRLFDPEIVQSEIKGQRNLLALLSEKFPDDGRIRLVPPTVVENTLRDNSAVAQPKRAPAPAPKAPVAPQPPAAPAIIRHTTADEEALDDDAPAPQVPEVVAAPSWLADLRGGPHRHGFYQSFDDYAVNLVQRSPDHLVVSFDNLSSVRDDPVDRESWGYGFIRKNGWSHMGVMAFKPSWFRDDELFDYMRGLADQGFFARFKSVTMIGTSMGAYAATAFAPLAPGCGVVAFSPQSTLKKSLVPWEKRFRPGRRADWSGDFADGAVAARAAGRVWLIYDPLFEEDRLHADRYQGANILRLRARYAGHKTALFLRRAGLLSTVVSEAVTGRLDEQRFYALYRTGRALPWYLNGIADRIAASQRPDRLQAYRQILTGLGRPQIARLLSDRFPEILSA